jgi:hypothetical protein
VRADPINLMDPTGRQGLAPTIPIPRPMIRPWPRFSDPVPPLPLPDPDESPEQRKERCRQVNDYCRAKCAEEGFGPRSDQGMKFFRYVNQCLLEYDCLGQQFASTCPAR